MGRHICETGAGKSGFHLKRKEEGCCSSKRILYLGYSGLKQDNRGVVEVLTGEVGLNNSRFRVILCPTGKCTSSHLLPKVAREGRGSQIERYRSFQRGMRNHGNIHLSESNLKLRQMRKYSCRSSGSALHQAVYSSQLEQSDSLW